MMQSLRLGARKIFRYPAVSSILFLTLTLGIAVSSTIFAVTWSTLVRPLPFRDQGQLVQLWVNDLKSNVLRLELSFDELEQIGKESRTIESIGGFSAANFPVVVKRSKEPMQLSGNLADARFFSTLGAAPAMGRGFNTVELTPNGPGACILSDKAWKERFGGNPDILRETIYTAGVPLAIVGVLPPNFPVPPGAEILLPLTPPTEPADRANRVLTAVARMRKGVSIAAAARELEVIGAHVQAAHPEFRHEEIIIAYPLVDQILGSTKPALRIVFAMGMLVLLIALLNAASVALVQGVGRTSEIGVRGAVGATRLSCVTAFFLESSVISLASAVAGVALAKLLLAGLLQAAPVDTPRLAELSIGLPTLLFAICTAIVAALIAAAAQTFSARQSEVMAALRASSKSTTHRGARRLLEGLAAAQTAVAIVTLVVATLLVQSFRRYESIDVGFTTDRVITFHVPRAYVMSADPVAERNFFRVAHESISQIDGVEASGSVLMRPLEVEQGWDYSFTVEGQGADEQERNPLSNFLACTPGYFDAMRVEILAGKAFSEHDSEKSPRVAVVGESFARRFWDDPARAIGKRLKPGKIDSDRPWMTVVAVVSDVRSRSLTSEKLDLYVPYTQSIWSPNYFAVRTRGKPETILPAVRQIIEKLDPESPVSAVRTTEELVAAKLAQPRLSAMIVLVFGATATLLSIIGFYGMLAYIVRERTPEMGVRMAFGADAAMVRKLIVRRAVAVALVGIVVGIVASIATQRVWQGYVYGSEGVDPGLLAAMAICFLVIAAIASLIPAARAASIDASAALKAE